MAEKKSIKVTVVEKELMVKGYETEEYMLRVAAYINTMKDSYEKMNDFHHTSNDIKYRMLMLNLADDFFKEKQRAEELDENLKEKINELDRMKHECVNKDVMLEDIKKERDKLLEDNRVSEKQIFELQTEMKSLQRELERTRELSAAETLTQRGGAQPSADGGKGSTESPAAKKDARAKTADRDGADAQLSLEGLVDAAEGARDQGTGEDRSKKRRP